ncbi:phosphoglucomutase [Canibacter oris]|uniref:Phosphoglucomutase n=1 Tax=Canibacter oris TaxID=1365628 RepID=A0A840DPE2_9MICO|nr:phosphoglucomutase [Canibacter oris]MBB4071419.1 phosphoglucomutase [Canibacter oris]
MSEKAGTIATAADLVDLAALKSAYYELRPDTANPAHLVAFGTSGHRGSAFNHSFNEAHIIAICIAVAEYRTAQGWAGPLFLGADTHPLSEYALATAKRILADVCGLHVVASAGDEYVPTPALSHEILKHNQQLRRASAAAGQEFDEAQLADGVIITPSHNPPQDGGIKYNPPHGGPADSDATGWIQNRANELLPELAAVADPHPVAAQLAATLRDGAAASLPARAGSVSEHDYVRSYVGDLDEVINMQAIRDAGVRFAAHPLGGAAVAYWHEIAAQHGLNLTVLGPGVDKQWSFMSLDWDGKIRMDPSSRNAMQAVLQLSGEFPLVVANDADADRHGIVCDGELMNPNHFLAVAIDYLLTHRPAWQQPFKVGKTIVSSSIIDRVVRSHGAELLEVPVGFKWFVPGLYSSTVVFGGEESAGASLLTLDGQPWSTDKDGIALCLLAAEIFAVTGKTPLQRYRELTALHGDPAYGRVDAPANSEQKAKLLALQAADVTVAELAGEEITQVLTHAPGNNAAIGGLVIRTANAWAAIRPSGTEAVMKVYAESLRGAAHLEQVQHDAARLLQELLG